MVFALQTIIISSLIGSLIWLILKLATPVTKKVFSARWHYYTTFISVLFFLNIALFFNPFFQQLNIVFEQNKIIDSVRSAIPFQPFDNPLQNSVVTDTAVQSPIVTENVVNINVWEIFNMIAPYILILWASGAILFFAFKIIEYMTLHKKIFESSVEFSNPFGTTKIIKSSYVSAPFVMGIFKPVIVLPDIYINEKDLAIILAHENEHLKHGDIILKVIALCANGLHWFNPLAYLANKQLDRLCETACDERLAKDMTKENRVLYCETILSMLENGIIQKNAVSVGLCSSKKYVKERLVNIMNTKKVKKRFIILSVIAVIVIFGIGGAVAYAVSGGNYDDIIETEETEIYISSVKESNELMPNIPSDITPDFIETNTALTEDIINDEENAIETEWWTYEEYSAWLEEYKIELQEAVGKMFYGWTNGGMYEPFVMTQELADKEIEASGSILAGIKNGTTGIVKTTNGEIIGWQIND
jgi:beta-lactamase regulating signal transducer with metallopeptidase domain